MNDTAEVGSEPIPTGSSELARTVAARLEQLRNGRKVRNRVTGEVMPLSVALLHRTAKAKFGEEAPVTARHFYRVTAGTTYPRLDTLWILAELFDVHPAYILGIDGIERPQRYPAFQPEAPNEITRWISELLQRYVTADDSDAEDGKISASELLDKIREHAAYEPVSNRHIDRLLKGLAVPRLNTIYAISEVIGIDPVDFLRIP